MVIKKLDKDHYEIKTKLSSVVIDGGAKINDFVIPGTGEYEVSDVEAEVFDGVYNFIIEGVRIVYLQKTKIKFSPEEIKKIADCNIIFIPVGAADTIDIKSATNLISETEPEIVIPIFFEDLAAFLKSEGSVVKEMPELKIAKKDINEEERIIIKLQ